MTAPGSQPVDPEVDAQHQADPTVTVTDHARTVVTSADSSSAPDRTWHHANRSEYAGEEMSGGNAPLGGWTQV